MTTQTIVDMKTLFQWRLALPKRIRKLYVKNIMTSDNSLTDKRDSLTDAIGSFRWGTTPQGRAFWDLIDDILLEGKDLPELDDGVSIENYVIILRTDR
tara:strand:+ start:1916 stop:2209 length:294 start_codon:yes stop_codon:yes gene_type:complete